MAKPSTTNAAPAATIHRIAAPGPVKAREPEEALTTGAAVICVPPDPDPVGSLVAGWTVDAVALVPADELVVADVGVVGIAEVVEDVDGAGGMTVVGVALVVGEVGGDSVVTVTAPAVVGDPPGSDVVGGGGMVTCAVATTGDAGEPDGGELTMPVGSLSLGKAVHFRLRSLPDTSIVNCALASSAIVTTPPAAENGPIVAGEEGNCSCNPDAGTGLGMGASMASDPVDIDGGEAPEASTVAVALPTMALLPRAAAAETMLDGRSTVVW